MNNIEIDATSEESKKDVIDLEKIRKGKEIELFLSSVTHVAVEKTGEVLSFGDWLLSLPSYDEVMSETKAVNREVQDYTEENKE